jgi:hypothetical protein
MAVSVVRSMRDGRSCHWIRWRQAAATAAALAGGGAAASPTASCAASAACRTASRPSHTTGAPSSPADATYAPARATYRPPPSPIQRHPPLPRASVECRGSAGSEPCDCARQLEWQPLIRRAHAPPRAPAHAARSWCSGVCRVVRPPSRAPGAPPERSRSACLPRRLRRPRLRCLPHRLARSVGEHPSHGPAPQHHWSAVLTSRCGVRARTSHLPTASLTRQPRRRAHQRRRHPRW